jgi:hypothetical protein
MNLNIHQKMRIQFHLVMYHFHYQCFLIQEFYINLLFLYHLFEVVNLLLNFTIICKMTIFFTFETFFFFSNFLLSCFL